MDAGDSPPASHINSPNPMDMGMWSEDDFFGHDQLQEDTEDSDGIPVSRVYHPILDGKLILIEYIYLLMWLFE